MTEVPIPDNYVSLENLAKWLRENMPHEYHIDGGARWIITQNRLDWAVRFARAHDATYFNLKWPR